MLTPYGYSGYVLDPLQLAGVVRIRTHILLYIRFDIRRTGQALIAYDCNITASLVLGHMDFRSIHNTTLQIRGQASLMENSFLD